MTEKIKLRDYQQRQMNFMLSKMKSPLPMGLESPTGSGKTVTILATVQEMMRHQNGQLFVLSTGFNDLVFQFQREADRYGIPNSILIGRGNAACTAKLMEAGEDPDQWPDFVHGPSNMKCSPNLCKTCNVKHLCKFQHAKNQVAHTNHLVITNHSSLLFYQHLFADADVIFVDEAHTFASFYEGFVNIQITPPEVQKIQSAVADVVADNDPVGKIFQMGLESGKISPQIMHTMSQKLGETELHPILINKMQDFARIHPSVDNHIQVDENGIMVHQFYTRFDLHTTARLVLVTATLDQFTLKMFNVHDTRIYREHDYQAVDFSQSELMISPNTFWDTLDQVLPVAQERDVQSGLILSTTLELVNQLVDRKIIHGYTITKSVKGFEQLRADGVQTLLVGSRGLFQGVDIHDLGLVMLNTIPFPRYDEAFQRHGQYLKQVGGMDPWRHFTIPKTVNDMLQGMGRLWRKPGDAGMVVISDPRICEGGRFHHMVKSLLLSKRGMPVTELPNLHPDEADGGNDGQE